MPILEGVLAKTLQSIRGMNDILPPQTTEWQYIEQLLFNLAANYTFQEIRFPYLEQAELFKRSVGEVTDIVAKEMYMFADRNQDMLALRPEGTACCVRAVLQHGMIHNQQQKLWYYGPMFRHERPQQGRYRQFYQFGLETFGIATPDAEVEQIAMMTRFWQSLGLQQHIELQLNTLGTAAVRVNYREMLVDYLQAYKTELDADSQQRLIHNPLRILDSKDPNTQAIVANAPKLQACWDAETEDHFKQLQILLDELQIAYTINPGLVRGLDYYSKTVFEWVTTELGAQGTVCAGGRYDQLVTMLGGRETPAVGLAMGMERILSLLANHQFTYPEVTTHVYWVMIGDAAERKGLQLSEALRTRYPGLKMQINLGGGSIKSQFKKADKSGAEVALVLGGDELAANQVVVKFLRQQQPQQTIAIDALLKDWLTTVFEDLL